MSWSDEKTLAFLRMYKNCPLLWDPTNNEYKNKNKRHESLMELSKHFGLDKNEVEKKIRSLQTQFARERKKEKYSQINGCDRGEPYISKWFGYKSMMFLINKHNPKTITAENEGPENQDVNNRGDNKDNRIEYETKNLSSPNKFQIAFPKKNLTIKRKQRFYSDLGTPFLNEALNLIKSIQTNMEDKDEYALFGEQVAVKLRKIPSPQARFNVQNIINKALFDAEMSMYCDSNNIQNNFYENSSPPSLDSLSPVSFSESIKSETINDIDDNIL